MTAPDPIFPHLVRDSLLLSQDVVNDLRLPPGRSEVIILAHRLSLAGATFVDKDVLIFADHVVTPGASPQDGITLTRSGPAATNTPGAPGCSLTIWTRTLGPAGGRSIGQEGGEGLPGADARDAVCPPIDPPGNDPDDPKHPDEPEVIRGEQGKKGKDGAKGGRGGQITVNVVGRALDGSAPAPEPQVWLGRGGNDGKGGRGGRGGLGCPHSDESQRGPRGRDGESPGTGDDVAVVVNPVTEQQLLDFYVSRAHHFVWAGLRMEAADVCARGGLVDDAERHLRQAELLGFGESSIITDIRTRMRHQLTPFGVETDVNLVPAIDQHRIAASAAVASFTALALPLGGHSVFHELTGQQLVDNHDELLAAHGPLAGAEIQQLRQERVERIGDLADAEKDIGSLVKNCQDRIVNSPAAPTITLPGGATMTARDIGDRIADVLAVPVPPGDVQTRRLLAADLDLLAPAAANDRYPMPVHDLAQVHTPAQRALVELRAAGVGLAGAVPSAATVNPADWANPAVVVSFGRVRREVRTAGGDPRLLLELTELVELAHRSRVVQLRRLQTDEAAVIQKQLADDIQSTQHLLTFAPDEGFPPEVLGVRYLRAYRDAANIMAWRAHAVERSVSLYTLDATASGVAVPESVVPPMVSLSSLLFSHDLEDQCRCDPADLDPLLEVLLALPAELDPDARVREYTGPGRGTFVEGRGDSSVDQLGFDSDAHPGVIGRLKVDRNVWFDATVDDLSPARFEHKVVGVGFTFFGLQVPQPPGGAPVREVNLTVEHSGLSSQRRLDGAVVPQYLLPGSVTVTVKQLGDEVDGFSDTWSGFMRYDDPTDGVPPDDPQHPGQTVTEAAAFPLWGRGAAAGWRFAFDDLVELSPLTRFFFQVEYDAFTMKDQVSLRRVEQPLGALVPGRTVQARALLTGPAPTGGLRLSLRSDNPAVLSVPAAVTVPVGADQVDLPVTVTGTSTVPAQLTVTSPDGFSRRALALVHPPAPGRPAPVSTLDAKAPGEVNGNIGGMAFAGDRLITCYTPAVLHPDGTLANAEAGSMLSIATSAGGMSGLRRFGVAKAPRAVAVGGDRAYLIDGDPDTFALVVVDLATGRPTVTVPVGFSPIQVAVDPTANLVYLSNHGQRRVDVHHGTTGARLDSVEGLRGPQGLAVDPQRRRVYVACSFRSNGPDDTENGLAVIDRRPNGTHALNRIIPLEGRNTPMDVALDGVRGLVHVANLGVAGLHLPGITTFRAAGLAPLGHTPVPGPLICLDVHAATGAVYCGGPAPAVHAVDGATRRYLFSHPVTENVQAIAVHQPSGAVHTGDRVSGRIARLRPVDLGTSTWR